MNRPYSPEAHKHIINNLRANNANLEPFTDEQIYYAWDQWSVSDEYPDERYIREWIDTGSLDYE